MTGTRVWFIELFALQDELGIDFEPMILLLCCAGIEAVQGRWQQSTRFEGAAFFHPARIG